MLDKDYFIITITNYYFPTLGGISTYIHSLCIGLNKKGVCNKVIQFPVKFRNIEDIFYGKKYLKKAIHVILVIIFLAYVEILILIYKIRKRKIIIHSHSASFCLLISVISKIFFTKTLHTFHSPIESRSFILEYFASMVDALVFVSKATKNQYLKRLKIYNKRIKIIPGGVDENIFYPRSRKEKAILREKYGSRLGIGEDDKLILYVGRVVEDKGVLPLIESFIDINDQFPNTKLVIVGPYNNTTDQKRYYKVLSEKVNRYKINSSVIFLGKISTEEIVEIYAICDIFVCPSLWEEPFGLVVLEAMASGKPTIVTNVGGLSEWVTDSDTGIIIEPKNKKELFTKIYMLLRNDDKRISMGKRAREHVEYNFTNEVLVSKHMQLYDELYD